MCLHVEVNDGDVDTFARLHSDAPDTLAVDRIRLRVVGTRQLSTGTIQQSTTAYTNRISQSLSGSIDQSMNARINQLINQSIFVY